MLKADLHIHTSEDKQDMIWYNAKDVIDRASSLNFKVLSFTLHNSVFYDKKTIDYAKKQGILLIPGAEITLEGYHVLVYNITDAQRKQLKSFDDLRRLKKKAKILVVAPHPYFKEKYCLGDKLIEHIDLFDAIEFCHFYTNFFNMNKKGIEVSKTYNKPMIGNSDSHLKLQFSKTYSLIDAQQSILSVLGAIKKGKIKVITKPLPWYTFLQIAAFAFTSYFLGNILQRHKSF